MHRNAYLLLTLTTLFWGANAVVGKLAVGEISPMLLNLVRWIIAAGLLYLVSRARLRAEWPIVRRHKGLLFALAVSGMTLFSAGLYLAVTYTSAINASIMQASMPLIVFLASFALYGATVSPLQVVGFLLSVGGVAVTVSHGDLGRLLELDLNVGDAIMFAAVVAYGLYTVGLRRRPPLHWQTLMFSLMAAAAITSLPLALVEWLRGEAGWPTARGWAIVAFAGIFPSLLSQAFYVRGVELIGGNRAGLFVNLVPIFGTLLSILVLGEDFHLYHALALLLVLGGIALAEVAARGQEAR